MRTLIKSFFLTIVTLLIFFLFVMKIIARLAYRLGYSAPCPTSVAGLLNHPLRWTYLRKAIARSDMQPGEMVLELGPGPGIITVEIAPILQPGGKLFTLDIQEEMIAKLEHRVSAAGLDNVIAQVGDACQLPFDDDSLDRAVLVSVLPEIPDRERALAELRRVLKSGGILSITGEFTDPDYLFVSETIQLVTGTGFRLVEKHGNPWCYTVNFI